jgi:tetratricopeptide (TPR) repeat protein
VLSGQFTSPVLATRLYQLSTVAILCGIGGFGRPDQANGNSWFRAVSWLGGAAFLLFGIALFASDFRAGALRRSVEKKDVPEAVARYRQMTKLALPGFDIDLYVSRSLVQLSGGSGDWKQQALAWQEAVRAGERATQTAEDRQNAFFNLAQLSARQNDIPGTERNLRAAILAAPNWFKPHWVLAELLRRTGRLQEAKEQAGLAFERDAGKDAQVTRTWQDLSSVSPR